MFYQKRVPGDDAMGQLACLQACKKVFLALNIMYAISPKVEFSVEFKSENHFVIGSL